jgi:hypothetical protein
VVDTKRLVLPYRTTPVSAFIVTNWAIIASPILLYNLLAPNFFDPVARISHDLSSRFKSERPKLHNLEFQNIIEKESTVVITVMVVLRRRHFFLCDLF